MKKLQSGRIQRVVGCFFIFLCIMVFTGGTPVFAAEPTITITSFGDSAKYCTPMIFTAGVNYNNPTSDELIMTVTNEILPALYDRPLPANSDGYINLTAEISQAVISELTSPGSHTLRVMITEDHSYPPVPIVSDERNYEVLDCGEDFVLTFESEPTYCQGSSPVIPATFSSPSLNTGDQIHVDFLDEFQNAISSMIPVGNFNLLDWAPVPLNNSIDTLGPHSLSIVAGTAYQVNAPILSATAYFEVVACNEVISVPLDIKPGSCANPLNVKSNGVLPVAVFGSENLDVNEIDTDTITLNGVTPIRSRIRDMATSSKGNCRRFYRDGIQDLKLKFSTQDIVAALGDVNDGDSVTVTLNGNLIDGTEIEGEDTVLILKKGKKGKKGKK